MNYLPGKKNIQILVTCEHGGNRVPARYRKVFSGRERLLNSHRGYDRHALSLAKLLARMLEATLFSSSISRLLVDLNRSPRHPKLFSEISRALDRSEKNHIINRYYLPYRRGVESCIASAASKGTATLHLSVHSFAPVINGVRKKADMGLLYDPSRDPEKSHCIQWQACIRETAPAIKVRRNYPYLGRADGLITYLRRIFPPDLYIGVELEFNRELIEDNGRLRRALPGIVVPCISSIRSY